MTPKGNSRANGISERESNNEANCEADCNIARHNLAGAFSAGGDGGRKSPEHSRAALTRVAALSGSNCGCCEHKKGASLYAPGSSRTRGNSSTVNGSRPEDLRLLRDPKRGKLFDGGFHCDRGGTVPLALLTMFLDAKIALTGVQRAQLPVSMNSRIGRRA
jgi:hypothetical protein